jgi:DNA-binding transcriptional LysR family regulator
MGRAAVRINMAQPTLSEQIKQLEEGLRTQLFLKTGQVAS